MRNLLLLIVTLFTASVFAQTDSTKVDVSELVKEQIEIAQAKQQYNTISGKEKDKTQTEVRKPYVVKRIPKKSAESGIAWKLLVMLVASGAAAAVIVYRRRKITDSTERDKDLKRNIKYIREERVIKKDNPYLRQIRFNLLAGAGKGELTEDAVTNAARKLQISREEILLANRIHSHKMLNAS